MTGPAAAVRRGIYALTDRRLCGGRLVESVAAAIRGGVSLVQYRDKGDDQARRAREVASLLEVCRPAGIPLIVNDDVELAARTGADGVHVGRDDAALAEARDRLGSAAIIGVSCYDSLERARQADRAGADYVAFGSFFASPTKPHAVRAPVELLRRARAEIGRPIAAIGGIDEHRGATLVEAGADLLAVITALFAPDDVEASARRLHAMFAGAGPAPASEPIASGD